MVRSLRRFEAPVRRLFRIEPRQVEVFKRLTLTALSVSLLVYVLKLAHVFEGFETRWLDVMAFVDRPSFRQPISVVGISDADYYDPNQFAGTSPLDPEILGRLLEQIGRAHV